MLFDDLENKVDKISFFSFVITSCCTGNYSVRPPGEMFWRWGKCFWRCWKCFRRCCDDLIRAEEQAIPKCWKSSRQSRRLGWISRNLLWSKGKKTEVCVLKKQCQVIWEKHRDASCHFSQKICVAKVQLGVKMSRNKLGVRGKLFFNVHSWVTWKMPGVGLGDSDGFLSTQDILWFCKSVKI